MPKRDIGEDVKERRALQVIITVMEGEYNFKAGKDERPMRVDALWLQPGGEPQPCDRPELVVKLLDAARMAVLHNITIDFPDLIKVAAGGGLDAH